MQLIAIAIYCPRPLSWFRRRLEHRIGVSVAFAFSKSETDRRCHFSVWLDVQESWLNLLGHAIHTAAWYIENPSSFSEYRFWVEWDAKIFCKITNTWKRAYFFIATPASPRRKKNLVEPMKFSPTAIEVERSWFLPRLARAFKWYRFWTLCCRTGNLLHGFICCPKIFQNRPREQSSSVWPDVHMAWY